MGWLDGRVDERCVYPSMTSDDHGGHIVEKELP